MKKKALSLLLALTVLVCLVAIQAGAETLPAGGAYMVAADGSETAVADPAAAWATGNYAYVKLYGQTDAFADLGGAALWVDLNGNDLAVGGSGKVYAFDSANDAYDAAACGTLTFGADVQVQIDVTAPVSENRYLAVAEGNTATFHRLDARLTAVTLRAAEMGLYYKAIYNCDEVLSAKVKNYGVVLSTGDMPGADFLEEDPLLGSKNSYTVAVDPFKSGVVANSGAVFGIMKQDYNSSYNGMRGLFKIYANPYIVFDMGQDLVVVGDNENAGKSASDEDFTGIAFSLCDLMKSIDNNYYSYDKEEQERVDQFRGTWKNAGMSWTFNEIDKRIRVDNSDLQLTDGVGYCPVCKKDVQWTPIVSGENNIVFSNDGDHYYLAEDEVTLSVSSSVAAGAIGAPGKDKTGCLHLNGKKLTTPNTCAIYGSSGTLNIMGNGTVWGKRNKSYFGDAIQINNEAGGIINLFGGTYTNSERTGAVITVANAGGTVNIYEDAVIKPGDAEGGTAVQFGIGSGKKPAIVNIYGGKVIGGWIYSRGATTNDNILNIISAEITGSVKMTATDTVYISGETTIAQVNVPEFAKLNLRQLAANAAIGITAEGEFAQSKLHAEENAKRLTLSNKYQGITIRDGILISGKDYTSSKPVAGGYCPVCEKNVTWKVLTADMQGNLAEGHYYLADNITYTGTTTAFIAGPSSGKNACVHLNGKDITATKSIAIYSGAGILNVMGTGNVTGYNTGYVGGAAVHSNNSTSSMRINLYAGTYRQYSGTASSAYTISVRSAGGNVNIYKDAEVESNVSGKAVYMADTGDACVVSVRLYGATVNGEVYLQGATYDEERSVLVIDDAIVNGNVLVNGQNTVTVAHAPKVQYLGLSLETKLILDRMTKGAAITVRANDRFTYPHSEAAEYIKYFTPVNKVSSLSVVDNVIVCKTDYNKPLKFTGNVAYCPVCEKDVQWTQLKAADENGTMKTLTAGTHYYLAESQTFTATNATDSYAFIKAPGSGQACLHLNGNNLYATNTRAIYGNGGVLNVMGNGEVAGKATATNVGAAVQINSGLTGNAINLYGGTYKKYAGSSDTTAAIAIRNAGTLNIHEDAKVDCGTGSAIYLGRAWDNYKAELNLYGCTVTGNIVTEGNEDVSNMKDAILFAQNVTVNGTVDILGQNNVVTFKGKTVINKLNVAEGLLVDFADMLEGSAIKVSATGIFTPVMGEADHFAPYFTTDDAGDWVVCRDYKLTQIQKTTLQNANEQESAKLESLYAGRLPYHGEMHNHAKTGGKSDGNYTLTELAKNMEERRIDFATIVDHKQSIHMYLDEWKNTCFIGASEAALPNVYGVNATNRNMDYNMIFAEPSAFEAHLQSIKGYGYTAAEDGNGGFYNYLNFTIAERAAMAQSVLDHGGFFTHVHPKLDGYMNSKNVLDYYTVDGTGLEIATLANGKYTMNSKHCVEAYELWVDLLELDKRIFATIGDDSHAFSGPESLATIYSAEKTPEAIVDLYRAGDLTAGPVGIRMNIGDVITGGVTSFVDAKLVLSVGDIHELVYNADHKYAIEVYDDGGLIFTSEINPSEMTYFAVDVDSGRKFYRAVVVDLTEGARVAVGNPIWNEAIWAE